MSSPHGGVLNSVTSEWHQKWISCHLDSRTSWRVLTSGPEILRPLQWMLWLLHGVSSTWSMPFLLYSTSLVFCSWSRWNALQTGENAVLTIPTPTPNSLWFFFESSWPCVPKASLPSCFLVLALSAIPLKPMSSGTGDCQRWSSLPSWSLGRCCLLTKSSITPGSPILSGTRPINVIQISTPLTILSFVKGVAHISHLVHFLLLRGTLTCFFRPFRGCPSSPLGMSNLTCKVAFLNAITSEWRVSELAILAFSGVTQAQGCPEA